MSNHTIGGTFSAVLGAVYIAATTTENAMRLAGRVVDEGHMLANVADKKLQAYEANVIMDTDIKRARRLKELEAEAAELGLEI